MYKFIEDSVGDISVYTKSKNTICQITGLEKNREKSRKDDRYKLFHDSVYEYFEELYPEFRNNKKGIINHKFRCYLNLLFEKQYSIYIINRQIIESKYKQFVPTSYEYFLRKSNGDEILASKLHNERQSTTSLKSFVSRFGEIEGTKKFNDHFKNIHEKCSGENHWFNSIDISLTEHIANVRNISIQEAKNLISCRKSLEDKGLSEIDIKNYFSNRGRYARSKYNDQSLNKFQDSQRKNIQKLKDSGKFYEEYGCWGKCYKYAIEHNIEYTEVNRKDIWNIIFNVNDIRHWILKGFSESEGKKKISKLYSKESISSIKCLKVLADEFNITILSEHLVEKYRVDGFIEDKKCIIEFFGDYWHQNPKLFSKDSKCRNKIASNIWEFDNSKLEYLSDLGYKCFVIWEYDWNNNKNSVLEDFNKFINE